MPVQRACDAESQAGNGAPNGPPRVQSNVGDRKVCATAPKSRNRPANCGVSSHRSSTALPTARWPSEHGHHIYEGDIFQIVLSNRLSAPFDLYQGDSKYRQGKRNAGGECCTAVSEPGRCGEVYLPQRLAAH